MAKQTFQWTIQDEMILERVKKIQSEGITDTAFAKDCGLDPGNFLKFKKKTLPLGLTYMRRICDRHRISFDWLATGKGEMNDPTGFVSEPVPSFGAMRKNHQQDIEVEILKAENETLRNVMENVTGMLQSLNEMIQLNRQLLEKTSESLSQNRVIMQYLIQQLGKENK